MTPGTRPAGVYTAGAAQRLVNRQNMMVGKKVVILGSGDIGMIMARRLTLEGAKVKAVVELIDVLKSEYSVDSDRVYATGISMGGYGTWDLLARHSELFAAAIPVCGGVDVSLASIFKDIPIYTFHGLKDTTVPPTGTLNVYNAIKNLGGNKIKLITYDNGSHSIWDTAYGTSGLIEWLLTHKLSDRTVRDETEDTSVLTTVPTDTTTQDVPTDTTAENTSAVETILEDTAVTTENNSDSSCGGISLLATFISVTVGILGVAILKKY